MRFASTSEVPTPWLCLEQDIREAGIDPAQIPRITDNSMAESVAALHDGRLDVAQLFEPFVEQAVSGGAAIWYPASGRGPTSYTVFVTTRDRLANDPEPFRRMARAMRRTQRWVASETPGALAAAIADYFPDLDRGCADPLAGALQGAGCVGRRSATVRGRVPAAAAGAAWQRFSDACGAVRRMRGQPSRRGGRRGGVIVPPQMPTWSSRRRPGPTRQPHGR